MTGKEAGEKRGVTDRMVNYYCSAGRIPAAIKKANLRLIPADAEKPEDRRYKTNQEPDNSGGTTYFSGGDNYFLDLVNDRLYCFSRHAK